MRGADSSRIAEHEAEAVETRIELATIAKLEDLTERLQELVERLENASETAPSLERRTGTLPDDVDGRRVALEPAHVRVLFVTMPIFPGEATNFYLANSHLFRCIRGTFIRAVAPSVPQGERFLWYFKEKGCFLWHLPPEPGQGPGRPRAEWVKRSVDELAATFRQLQPDHIIGVKGRLRSRIEQAAERAGLAGHVTIVETPRMLWDPHVIALLRGMLRGSARTGRDASSTAQPVSLVEALQQTILQHSNRRHRARELADVLAAEGFVADDGAALRKADVSAAIREHRRLFDVNSAGVRIRDAGDARAFRRARVSLRRDP